MNWYIKILSFIDIKTLLEILSQDKKYFKKVCEKILNNFYEIDDKSIKNINLIPSFLNMYPRISYFSSDNLSYENEIFCQKNIGFSNRYLLLGKPSKKFIFSDKVLPNYMNCNVPFTFYLTNQNYESEFLSSNIYYFEVKIEKKCFKEELIIEEFYIGFISALYDSEDFNFGDHFSFGLDFSKNIFKINDSILQIPNKLEKGDTFGLGLELISRNSYRIIFTVNGTRIYFDNNLDYVISNHFLKIGMNIQLNNAIIINFGDEPFLFNIKDCIDSSKVLNISNNNFLQLGFQFEFINTKNIFEKNYFWKKNLLKKKKKNTSESI